MKIIDTRTVELTSHEVDALDRFEELLDEGFSLSEAVEELLIEQHLSKDFINWLLEPF